MIFTQQPFDPTSLLNYGVLGVVLALLIFGFIWVKPAVDNLKAERDRAIADRERAALQRDEAMSVAQEKLVPLLTTFVATVETLIPLLQQMVNRQSEDRDARAGLYDRRKTD